MGGQGWQIGAQLGGAKRLGALSGALRVIVATDNWPVMAWPEVLDGKSAALAACFDRAEVKALLELTALGRQTTQHAILCAFI